MEGLIGEEAEDLGVTEEEKASLMIFLYDTFGNKDTMKHILKGGAMEVAPQGVKVDVGDLREEGSKRKRGREDSVSGEQPSRAKKGKMREIEGGESDRRDVGRKVSGVGFLIIILTKKCCLGALGGCTFKADEDEAFGRSREREREGTG